MAIRLPTNGDRLLIYGQTGSGKTVDLLWHLEQRDWTVRPWYLFDFKGDPTIAKIPRLEEIDVRAAPPKQPGLYAVRPLPDQGEEVDAFLWSVWEAERRGLAVDEAYMIQRFSKAMDAIWTQGRAKRIPVIAGAQRPAWLSRFAMSETTFHQVKHVQNPADFARLAEWIPGLRPTVRDYSSQYYDVARSKLTYLDPVPGEDVILQRFDDKMPKPINRRLFADWLTNAPASRGARRIADAD